jgi:hypothetical protein
MIDDNSGPGIAFVPQTFISRVLRRYYGDFRWQKQVNHTWAST